MGDGRTANEAAAAVAGEVSAATEVMILYGRVENYVSYNRPAGTPTSVHFDTPSRLVSSRLH